MRALSFGLVLSLLLAVAAGCGGSSKPAVTSASGPFAYDSSQPLRFADRGRVNSRYPIAIDDVSYTAGGDQCVLGATAGWRQASARGGLRARLGR